MPVIRRPRRIARHQSLSYVLPQRLQVQAGKLVGVAGIGPGSSGRLMGHMRRTPGERILVKDAKIELIWPPVSVGFGFGGWSFVVAVMEGTATHSCCFCRFGLKDSD